MNACPRVDRPWIVFKCWDQIPSEYPERFPAPDWSANYKAALAEAGCDQLARPFFVPALKTFLQNGFHLFNEGQRASEITVKDFEIEPSVHARSATINGIGREERGFALIWLVGYGPDIWDLRGAMARAWERRFGSPTYAPDYAIRVQVEYRDVAGHWYRSSADLKYVRVRGDSCLAQRNTRKASGSSPRMNLCGCGRQMWLTLDRWKRLVQKQSLEGTPRHSQMTLS